jgi:glyoxylase-like metal-dependent hydrolase (beta-lactamase superfamily II)
MQALANQVYIEEQYPGVTLGVIALPHGLIQIDAPPAPEDGRSWRAALLNLNSGVERILINLDGHPDRTLGARAMDCTIVAHERTAETFRNRPNTFKAQGEETGADWESVIGLGSIRWAPPEISFTSQMTIEWSNFTVLLEHHPGPTAGASWIILPEPKIIFVGDLVVKNQPPFIASANLSEWLKSLDHLLEDYKDYTIVSGRSGVVTSAIAQAQREKINTIHEQLEELAQKHSGPDAVESLIQPLMTGIKVPAEKQKQYFQRLAHGLRHYYARHYRSTGTADESEE